MELGQREELIQHLDSCRYWQGISECQCDSLFPIGGCLRCDMDKAIELLVRIIKT